MLDSKTSIVAFRNRLPGRALFKQDRFQVLVFLIVLMYKVRSCCSLTVTMSVCSIVLDIMAVAIMSCMRRDDLSCMTLLLMISINSVKFVCFGQLNLHVLVAVFAAWLTLRRFECYGLVGVACVPALVAHAGVLPSPFALAYLFESFVALPILFRTIPNRFGSRTEVCCYACHAVACLLIARAALGQHYFDMGIHRLFQGPWDVPTIFRGRDMLAATARSIGFLMHMLQAGFSVKFAFMYVPAFCAPGHFQLPDVGCGLRLCRILHSNKTVDHASNTPNSNSCERQ